MLRRSFKVISKELTSFDQFSYPVKIWCDFKNDANSHHGWSAFLVLASKSKTLASYVNNAMQIAVSQLHHMLGQEVSHFLLFLCAYPHTCFGSVKVKVKKIILKNNKNISTLRRNESMPQVSLVFYCTAWCPFCHAMP